MQKNPLYKAFMCLWLSVLCGLLDRYEILIFTCQCHDKYKASY